MKFVTLSDGTTHSVASVVVGGAGGIGTGIVSRLLREQHYVCVIDRSNANCSSLRAKIPADSDLEVHVSDALDAAYMDRVLNDLVENKHCICNLIYCAGSAATKRAFRAMPIEQWNSVIDDSLTAAFVAAQSVVKRMHQNAFGRIVFISSVFAMHIGTSLDDVAYTAAKSGLHGMVSSLARTLGRRNITVNAVAPGLVATPLTATILDPALGIMSAGASWRIVCPIPRICTPEDVAGVVSFLLSEDAGYVNGAIIPVDGGFHC